MSKAGKKKSDNLAHYLVLGDIESLHALCGPRAVGTMVRGVKAVTCCKCKHLLTTRRGMFK